MKITHFTRECPFCESFTSTGFWCSKCETVAIIPMRGDSVVDEYGMAGIINDAIDKQNYSVFWIEREIKNAELGGTFKLETKQAHIREFAIGSWEDFASTRALMIIGEGDGVRETLYMYLRHLAEHDIREKLKSILPEMYGIDTMLADVKLTLTLTFNNIRQTQETIVSAPNDDPTLLQHKFLAYTSKTVPMTSVVFLRDLKGANKGDIGQAIRMKVRNGDVFFDVGCGDVYLKDLQERVDIALKVD